MLCPFLKTECREDCALFIFFPLTRPIDANKDNFVCTNGYCSFFKGIKIKADEVTYK